MTGNDIGTKGSRAAAHRQSEVRSAGSSSRPYYWSWYGTVFDDPGPAGKLPTVFPRNDR